MTKEFKLSEYQETEYSEKFLEIYNGLAEGELITVSSTDDFKERILTIQSTIDGPFFWAATQLGTPVWKGIFVNFNTTPHMAGSITQFMKYDHERCDGVYAEGESKILEGDPETGFEILQGFIIGMRRHFKIEEEVFFPAFEENTGMTQGPTQVMKMEHEQMRAIMSQMQEAISAGSEEQITALGETILVLMQQHNMKEEQMLYFMMEQHISHLAADLIKVALKIDFS